MARKHNVEEVEEVIRNLTSKKGCIITTDNPITKRIKTYELSNKDIILKKYEQQKQKSLH